MAGAFLDTVKTNHAFYAVFALHKRGTATSLQKYPLDMFEHENGNTRKIESKEDVFSCLPMHPQNVNAQFIPWGDIGKVGRLSE